MKNNRRNTLIILLLITSLVTLSCNTPKKQQLTPKDAGASLQVVQKTIIYKTTDNFTKYVPVTLDNSKQHLLSYPDPTDLRIESEFMTPQLLAGGYVLDRRGITINSVFTNYTYEEYSKLKTAPAPNEILNNLKEKNPISELYQCPLTKDTAILNQWIHEGIEKYCKKLK